MTPAAITTLITGTVADISTAMLAILTVLVVITGALVAFKFGKRWVTKTAK